MARLGPSRPACDSSRRTSSRRGRGLRAAFTLVELLVVMTIIGILAALAATYLFTARRTADSFVQYQEVTKLASAVSQFQSHFEYLPPDGSGGGQDINKFVRAAFPSRKRGASPPPTDLNPATSLVFWLSRVHQDRLDPFKQIRPGDPNQRLHIFFEFSDRQLFQNAYYPPRSDPQDGHAPYVYFQFSTYQNASYQHRGARSGGGAFRPYQIPGGSQTSGGSSGSQIPQFANPESFQIIAPGLDRQLGSGGMLLSRNVQANVKYIQPEDEDNRVNFDERLIGDIRY
jgi:prepilin-type N-terminal cleavage/methylation domain-containing protein